MKTVKPKVLTSTRIRLSKAASILSKFASTETGASQAVGAYLRRASDAFIELAHLHKVLKSSSSRSHRKTHSDYETEATVGAEENGNRAPERIQERSHTGEETERKRHKKKSDETGEFVNSFDGNIDAASAKKKHKKRRKERGDVGNSEEEGFQNGKVETGVKSETNEVEEKERKKRKSVEVEEVGEIGFEEQRSKKKKRKSGDGDN